MNNQYVAYYRVSTQRQNASHLGMEAQQKMCENFVRSQNGTIVKEFEDVESGKSQTRQGLWNAIEYCKEHDCPLVIARLDRLARNVEFTFRIINTGVEIHFTDMPMVNTMILGVFASVAQYEREMISLRTKQALQAKKARGETWHRNSDTTKASRVSADNRIEDARNDQANLFFYKYWKAYAERNADKEKNKAYYNQLANELNALGQRTCKGLEYTGQIVQNRIVRMRQLYEGVERKKRTITAYKQRIMKGVNNVFNLQNGEKKEKGVATIKGFTIDADRRKAFNLKSLFSGNIGFERVTEGDFVKLYVNNCLMMSDTDMEKRTNAAFIANAHGDVMIAGLGIGLILHNLEDKVRTGEVTSITVYEKYQDVIDLVAPYYSHLPLTIKREDILEYKPQKGETYDTIYFDIWPSISTDNLDDIKILHNRWKFRKRKGGWMDSWVKDYLQREKRKEYNNSYWW